MTATQRIAATDEAAIRRLIDDQFAAICAKKLDEIVKPYRDDAVLFDVKPPWQSFGRQEWRELWAACLPYFPDGLATEIRDMHVVVGGDVAFAHWLWRCTSSDTNSGATKTWLRVTACYRKTNGQWQIAHEHISVPFDPMTGKAVLSLQI